MICAVSILSKMAAECLRQATAFKISYHMVKITSQVQKIRSGCIFLILLVERQHFTTQGGHKNLTKSGKT